MTKRIGVVLCGSGFKDGSEIRESVGVLWALSRHGAVAECFAPDAPQADVINCLTGEPVAGETRNQLVEAARIARGKVRPLTRLKVAELDGLILPGGFGAAKNLCNFAQAGVDATVRPELLAVLKEAKEMKKPIGAVCIAPAILALAFKGEGLELTVGPESDAARAIEKLGHRHVARAPNECHLDRNHRVVTTPAYMVDDAPLHEIFAGIDALVEAVLGLAE